MHKTSRRIALLALSIFLLAGIVTAQDAEFNKAEFAARRAKVMEKIGDGALIIFANEFHPHAVKFRQSPDFYYLTGIEEPGAILFMSGQSKRSVVFARKPDPNRAIIDGPGALDMKDPAAYYGLSGIYPMEDFNKTVNFRLTHSKTLFVQLTPPDELQYARTEVSMNEVDALENPLIGELSRIKQGLARIKKSYPHLSLADTAPIIDELRWVKSPFEIERMRMAGKIGAEGIKEAMKGTRPGMWEYQIEATARYVYNNMGARGDAFTPIVASGPNTMVLHWVKNNRQMKDGEIVLLDYGADYDYYTSDITRTWPVSGRFSPEQERWYRCVLEARNAIIAMMKPGINMVDMQNAAGEVYKKHGFENEFNQFGRYVGHFIGMSVHDVGDTNKPFVPGVVFNVEPLIQNPVTNEHFRLEDTVLITEKGAENLTAGVPAELEEVYALLKMKRFGS